MLLDNVFLVRKAPAVKVRPDAGFLSAGNVFTVRDAVEAKPSAFRMDDKVVPYVSVKATYPQPPYIPPTEKRKVIEVRAGASAQEIQNAINQAARSERERPVLHLPAGIYAIDRPLVVPPQSDVCIVGDVQNDSPDAEMVMLESSRVLPGGGWTSVTDVGKPSPQFMKEMLALTRQTQPQPVDPVGVHTTDVRIHRILIGNVRYGLWLK